MSDPPQNAEPSFLDELCPITLSSFRHIGVDNIMFLPCFHKFDREAITKHIQNRNYHCPVCKKEFNPFALGIEVEKKKKPPLLDLTVFDSDDDTQGEDLGSTSDEEGEEGEDDSPGSLREFVVDDGGEDEDEEYQPSVHSEEEVINTSEEEAKFTDEEENLDSSKKQNPK